MDKFFHRFSHKEIPSPDTELNPKQPARTATGTHGLLKSPKQHRLEIPQWKPRSPQPGGRACNNEYQRALTYGYSDSESMDGGDHGATIKPQYPSWSLDPYSEIISEEEYMAEGDGNAEDNSESSLHLFSESLSAMDPGDLVSEPSQSNARCRIPTSLIPMSSERDSFVVLTKNRSEDGAKNSTKPPNHGEKPVEMTTAAEAWLHEVISAANDDFQMVIDAGEVSAGDSEDEVALFHQSPWEFPPGSAPNSPRNSPHWTLPDFKFGSVPSLLLNEMTKEEDEGFNGYPSWAFCGEWELSPRLDESKGFTHDVEVVLPSTSQVDELDGIHKKFSALSLAHSFISRSTDSSSTSALSECDSDAGGLLVSSPMERPAVNNGRKDQEEESTFGPRDRPTSHSENLCEGDGKFPEKRKDAKGSKHSYSEFSYNGMEMPFVWVTAV